MSRQEELEKMDDLQLNCLLAKVLGADLPPNMFDGTPIPDGTCIEGTPLWRDGSTIYTPDWYSTKHLVAVPDFCNSLEDIIPLAVENKIGISPMQPEKEWEASRYFRNEDTITVEDINPYRAACIVLILTEEEETDR